MEAKLGSRPIAYVTEHSGLLLTVETPNGDALTTLQKMVEEEWSEAVRPLSPVPYTVGDDGRVVPYGRPQRSSRVGRRCGHSRNPAGAGCL